MSAPSEEQLRQPPGSVADSSPPATPDAGPREANTALEKVTSSVEEYPTGLKLALLLISIYLAVFLVALDRTIIATALPVITDHFHSIGDIGWVSLSLPFSTHHWTPLT